MQSNNGNKGSNVYALDQDIKGCQDIHGDHTNTQYLKRNPELKSLNFQVGGHRHDNQKPSSKGLGIYDSGKGTVLKTLQPPPRGLCELNFYKEVFHPECSDQDVLELREFLPTFYGTEEKEERTFLKLNNLMSNFKEPCIADLKMGQITYDPDASPEKIRTEESKFPDLKDIGFQFSGIILHDNDKPVYYNKPYCRSLTKNTIASKGLGCFFSILQEDRKREVIQQLMTRLRNVESWFLRQKKYSFIASSLLIIYEGYNASSPYNDFKLHCDKSTVKNTSSTSNDLAPSPPNELPLSNHSSINVMDKIIDGGKTVNVSIANHVTNIKRSFDDGDDDDVHSVSIDKTKRRKSNVMSSLDCDVHKTCNESKSSVEMPKKSPLITAHMIDFAHVFPGCGIDHNYLFGLQKLISFLKEMME